MNLGKHIANLILEEINQRTIAIYPGSFKPPHRGHLSVVKTALEKANEVIILISKSDRNGVQVGQSLKIWDLYLKLLGSDASRVKLQVAKSETPIRDFYDTVKEFPETKFLAVFGKNDSGRFKAATNKEKYPNVEILDIGNFDSISASKLRLAIKTSDIGEISNLIPKGIDPQDILKIVPPDTILAESKELINEMSDKELKYWAIYYDIFKQLNGEDFIEKYKKLKNELNGEKLEALNYFFKLVNDADSIKSLLENKIPKNNSEFKKFIRYIVEILEHCIKDLNIPRPEVSIINNDKYVMEHNSFGGYFPGQNKINLVIKNRNLSDVCRTLTHELKHAEQDHQGRLLTKEDAGKDGDEFENEANSYAGKVMREFNRKYPEILTLKND